MNKISACTLLMLATNIVTAHELTAFEELIKNELAQQPYFFSDCHPNGNFAIGVRACRPASYTDLLDNYDNLETTWVVMNNETEETPEITWARKASQCLDVDARWQEHVKAIFDKYAPKYHLKEFGRQAFINDDYEYYSGYATNPKYPSIYFSILIYTLTNTERRALEEEEEEEVLNQNPTTADTNDWCWPL